MSSTNITYAIETKDSNIRTNIEKIFIKSDNWVQVKFTEAIKPIQISNIKIYEKAKKTSLKFEVSIISDTEIKLRTDSQKPATRYIIEFTNITNIKGNVVKKITSSFVGYKNIEIKSDLFKISKVDQTSNNKIIIYFTHPVNTKVDQRKAFSILDGKKVLVNGNNISITAMKDKRNALIINIKNYKLKSDIEYTLKVNGSLLSEYGTYLGLETGDQITFIGKTIDENQLKPSFKDLDEYSVNTKIVSITPIDSNSIVIKFNKNVDPMLAQDISKYSIYKPYFYSLVKDSAGSRYETLYKTEQPISAVYSSDSPDSVKLYFWYDSPMLPFSKCTVSISSDLHTGGSLADKIVYEFSASNIQKIQPEIKSAIFIANNIVKIDFSHDISQYGLNILPQNYYIEPIGEDSIKIPLAVTYFDKNTIVLKFDNIDSTKNYNLMYYRLIDITAETFSGEKLSKEIMKGK